MKENETKRSLSLKRKILITGANSYIGTSFEKYVKQWPESYQTHTVDMLGDAWRETSFSGYDTVYHVAGIAHSDRGKICPKKEKLYFDVNAKLAIETAEKAKKDGVRQFIFMSSVIIYGDSAPVGQRKIITRETAVSPANCYGKSKLQAEKGIQALEDEQFKVVIIRCPMLYGKGCKGNYPILVKLAKNMPFFPLVENCRSMIYLDNLCEFVRLMIENEEQGIFWPQNKEYSNTSEMVKMIAESYGRNLRMTRIFNWCLPVMGRFTVLVNKAFGNLAYDQSLSQYKDNAYQIVSLSESIEKTKE